MWRSRVAVICTCVLTVAAALPTIAGAVPGPKTVGTSTPGATRCAKAVVAGPDTTCPFAFKVVHAANRAYRRRGRIPRYLTGVYSPVTGKHYSLRCVPSHGLVRCNILIQGDPGRVTFSQHLLTPGVHPHPFPNPVTIPRPTPTPPPAPTPTPSPSCYPTTPEGTCYEPGDFCSQSIQGETGIDGDGNPIICAYNNGWRWEPN